VKGLAHIALIGPIGTTNLCPARITIVHAHHYYAGIRHRRAGQMLYHVLTGRAGGPLSLEVSRLSFRHRGHLYRQVGTVQDHISVGAACTVRSKEEIGQLSISFTCAYVHLGHMGLGMFSVWHFFQGIAIHLRMRATSRSIEQIGTGCTPADNAGTHNRSVR
jgi:hypothetical protein